ncbi:MAG: ABC transporter permease [Nostoc sp.]|uniref:ABC transporter permease n=1 Tax=Nostoc sp. TaxID=1180 RepID=UPI002FFB71FD
MSLTTLDLIILTSSSLRSNVLRSFLTTLGVFMGVAAVNATLQVGSISRAMLAKQLSETEAPQILLFVTGEQIKQPSEEEIEFLRQRLKGLQGVSGSSYVPSQKVSFYGQEAQPNVQAVTKDYLLTSGRKLKAGRAFSTADFENYRSVAVIDEFLSQQLFQGQNPIGKLIFTTAKPCLVVGVMETKSGVDQKPTGVLLMPLSTYSAMTGKEAINSISVRPQHLEDMKNLKEQAEKILKERFPGGDVYATSNVDSIFQQQETLELATRGLTVVGIIALLIGGVGIANITIAAIVERTSEIGLRRAIGATKINILSQFILEAAILSLVGGIAAIITVYSLTLVVVDAFKLPYQFESQTAVLSLGAALLVGVGACFLPALRASELDPVKALREA